MRRTINKLLFRVENQPSYVYIIGILAGIVGLIGADTVLGHWLFVVFWLLTIFSCDLLARKYSFIDGAVDWWINNDWINGRTEG